MAPLNIFLTGGSGFIGGAITRLASAEGHTVRSLSRSEASDANVRANGGVPVRGDLVGSDDVLAQEARAADAVFFLGDAFNGSGWALPYPEVTRIHNACVDVLAGALAEKKDGPRRPLVCASGSLITTPRPDGSETTEDDPENPDAFVDRGAFSRHGLAWASRGVNVSMIRLAPWVYGHGASGVGLLVGMAAQSGVSIVVDGGQACTSFVHVDDAARMFLLAAQAGDAASGQCYNCVADTAVTYDDLARAVAATVGVPVKELTMEEAVAQLGAFLADFLVAPNRASSAKAKKQLGWQPQAVGVLEDIRVGSYVGAAQEAKARKM